MLGFEVNLERIDTSSIAYWGLSELQLFISCPSDTARYASEQCGTLLTSSPHELY